MPNLFTWCADSVYDHLEEGKDLEVLDLRGWTPLMYTSGNGCERLVKQLIEAGVNINQRGYANTTALLLACRTSKDARIVKWLLDAGADPNIKGEYDTTALAQACLYGNLKAVQYLLSFGATIEGRDSDNKTAFHCALINNDAEIIEQLVSAGANMNDIFEFDNYMYYFGKYPMLVRHLEKKENELEEKNLKRWKSHRLKTLFNV